MSSPAPQTPQLAAWIGIDWADQHHDIALRETGSDRVEHARIKSTPEALATWLAELRSRFGGKPVGVGLEQSRGALIHALLEHDFLVLYPINPATLDRFRKAFSSSGAKSDPEDAGLLLELLEKHSHRLHAWRPDDPDTRSLVRMVEARRKAVNQRTQLVQRLTAELKGYFPQALDWAGGDLTSAMAVAFLRRWPTLHSVRRARPETLRRFYSQHHCRSVDLINARLKQIRTAVPLVTDRGIVEPSVLTVRMLVGQLEALSAGVEAYDTRIRELFAAHPDADLFKCLPGSGAALAPRLLAAFGADPPALARPPRCSSTAESHRSPKPAARVDGSIAAGQRPNSCVKLFMNSPATPSAPRSGRAPITSRCGAAGRVTTQPCAHSPSNGSASCGSAGRTVLHTTKSSTSRHCASGALHSWSTCPRSPHESTTAVRHSPTPT